MWYVISKDELYHHGIKGQKWGIRRYQNPDGTLTEEGRKRYGVGSDGKMSQRGAKKWYKDVYSELINYENQATSEYDKTAEGKKKLDRYQKELEKMYNDEKYNDWNTFYKVEKDYLFNSELYAAKKIVEKYGDEYFQTYANEGNINLGRATVESFANKNWEYHTV